MIDWQITSGQMSYFEVEIEERMKVIHVEGMKQIPVKRWEVSKRKAKKSKAKDKDTPGATKAVLKVSPPDISDMTNWLAVVGVWTRGYV